MVALKSTNLIFVVFKWTDYTSARFVQMSKIPELDKIN